jgi:hypothetical protein
MAGSIFFFSINHLRAVFAPNSIEFSFWSIPCQRQKGVE